jgi:hypothetical protein
LKIEDIDKIGKIEKTGDYDVYRRSKQYYKGRRMG